MDELENIDFEGIGLFEDDGCGYDGPNLSFSKMNLIIMFIFIIDCLYQL